MDKEAFSFLLENIDNLSGFDVFLILVFSVVLSLMVFFVFRWIYSGLINSQKELINAKEQLVEHYRNINNQLTSESKSNAHTSQSNNNTEPQSNKEYDKGNEMQYGAVLKLGSCFYILEAATLLKNGLWAIALQAQTKEDFQEAQKYLYKLDEMIKHLSQNSFELQESAKISKDVPYEEFVGGLAKATSVSFNGYKAILSEVESYLRAHDFIKS